MKKKDIVEEYKIKRERVVRWDNYRINQFSYTNNLLIGLNLAFLSFFITKVNILIDVNCCLMIIQILTIFSLIISFITGMCNVINRLQVFRKTSKLTKIKKNKFEYDYNITHSYPNINSYPNISVLDSETKRLGKRTWILLKWQVWTFSIGVIIGVIYLVIQKYI